MFSSLVLAAAVAFAGQVTFKTPDGWKIVGSYIPAAKGKPTAILVHGVAAGRTEFDDLANALARRGVGSLAIDLRGHGESIEGPKGHRTYQSFSRKDFADAAGDVKAAAEFLRFKGVNGSKLGFVGGSLGANLAALQSGGFHALLSPGYEYAGVSLPKGWSGKRVLCAASAEDAYSYQTCRELERKKIEFLEGGAGHGAQLLADGAVLDRLTRFIEGLK